MKYYQCVMGDIPAFLSEPCRTHNWLVYNVRFAFLLEDKKRVEFRRLYLKLTV